MFRQPLFLSYPRRSAPAPCWRPSLLPIGLPFWLLALALIVLPVLPLSAVVLWSDLGETLVHENGDGHDILGGAVKRDDSAIDTLYFKFHVNPFSDTTTEEYFAAFELFEGDMERLGVGNALEAWAYSAFLNTDEFGESNKVLGYIDLHSAHPEVSPTGQWVTYQSPRKGVGSTIVFKVQYIADGDDLVTVWLNPDLGPGANEAFQPDALTTRFNANASFDEIRLRHSGGGGGWEFSDMAVATSFSDFVDVSSANTRNGDLSVREMLSLSFRVWQREHGLPDNAIRGLAQTRDGYLWVGTDDGLARFDGVRFVTFKAREGLPPVQVTTMYGDSHGALWIGSADNGLVRMQGGQFTTFSQAEGLPSRGVGALVEDNQGRIWVGTDAGLRIIANGAVTSLPGQEVLNGKPIVALFKDRHGDIWVGVRGVGIYQYTGGRFVPVTGPGTGELLKEVKCLLVDRSDRLWVGAGDEDVVCRDRDEWHDYRLPRHLARHHVNTLAEDVDGTIWAGLSGGGLFQFVDGKIVSLTGANGLVGSMVETILVDREGRLWVGTDGGLNQLQRRNLLALGQGEGLGYGPVLGLAEVSPGVVWASKSSDGLYRWDGRYFSRYPASGVSPKISEPTALLVTRDESCWVGDSNRLLYYKDPRAAVDEARIFDLPGSTVTALAEDSESALWVGTQEGKILRLFQGEWITPGGVSQTNAVTAITTQHDGSVWVGTDGGGLYCFRTNAFQIYTRGNGLLSNVIRSLHVDADGSLWIGTGSGLNMLQGDHIFGATVRDGLPSGNIVQILEDDSGRLWLGSSHGIICVTKHELGELFVGRITSLHPRVFGQQEGMLSEECTGGFSPAGLKTSSGILWFPTTKGLVVVNPRILPVKPPKPAVLLEEVLVDGAADADFRSDDSGTNSLQIGPGKHRIEFRYTGLTAETPEQLHFRYKLEGLDPDWVDAGIRRTAFYSYVPPGNYRFRIAAFTGAGVWTEGTAQMVLTVRQHFWQSLWFLFGFIIGTLILVIVIVRFVVRRKIQRRLARLEQERALERERTRIAQDLHDEMGAKLCRISFLSEHARRGDLRPEEWSEQISSISDASREVLHSLDEIVWAVNPRNDTLEHAASYIGQYAQEYFSMTGIECDLDLPTELPPHRFSSQVRHHLFLAVHEALTNILKHSHASRAKVSMTCDRSIFQIKVSDDGRGFDTSFIKSKLADPTGENDGLNNMHKRLADIGGTCRVEAHNDRGTTIWFELPLERLEKIK